MADESGGGWTRFFRRKDLTGENFFSQFLDGVARIFEGGDEQETYRQIRSELVRAFDCDDVSLFFHDTSERPGLLDGDWVLKVKSGFGEGNSVCQRDATELPELVPGKPVPFEEELAQKAALKAIALAYEEDAYYGCDIEKRKIVLLKDPTPEDDLGSGDLSVLAIPLRYHNRVGRVTEHTRVGVLVLFKTPVRRELGDLERSLRSLLAYAIVTPRCTLRDPVTDLFTESYLQEEMRRYMNLLELTGGKLRGGVVVGMIDALKLYKQTLESSGKVDPAQVSQLVSEVLRGVGACVWKRCREHQLQPGETYAAGFPGRVGHEGFGVVLPLLQPHELCMWAVRLSKEVIEYRFQGEELLVTGDVTVSLRVIPFAKGSFDDLWGLVERALGTIVDDQVRARRDPDDLALAVNTIQIFSKGRWISTSEFVSNIHT